MNEITARQGRRTGSFEFDEAQLRLICKDIFEKIDKKFENNLPINSKAEMRIKSPIDGQTHSFTLKIKQIEDPEIYMNEPAASWSNFYKEIIITVPNDATWFSIPQSDWEQIFYRSLVHELTHAFDIKGNIDSAKGNYQTAINNQNLEPYFNDPAEIKAYIGQVGTEIQDLLRKNSTLRGMRPDRLIQLSNTWSEINQFYQKNPKAMKMFLKSIFDIQNSM